MLTGIPCYDAISYMNQNIEDYIPDYHRKECYEAHYQSMIYLVNGQNLWEKTTYDDVLPLPIKRQPRRPKKSRRKEAGEECKNKTKMSRKGFKIKYRN